MNVLQLIFGILLVIFGIGIIYYQSKDGSYSKGERVTENQVNMSYGGIMAIIVGLIFIIRSL